MAYERSAPLNICLVGPIPPPAGGMAMQTLQLDKLLRARGHNVRLVAVNSAYKPAWVGNIPVLRAVFRLFAYTFSLWKALKGQDVVHLMANSGWSFHLYARPVVLLAGWRKVPVFLNYRGGGARTFFDGAWPKIRRAFANCEKVLVPSTFLQQVFRDFGCEAMVVPNIVDLSVFRYAPPKFDDQRLHLVVTRNLEAIYDNETAIRAFSSLVDKYPYARLTVAGDGPKRAELESLVKELGLQDKVSFVGRLVREDIAALYTSADVMLNPSKVDNMPNSILEALASGALVVSTDVGGIPHMVSNEEEALLVPPQSPQIMADAVCRLINDPLLAKRLAEAGLARVQAYQPEIVIPKLEALYRGNDA